MSRLPLVNNSVMTTEQREQYDRFPSNLTRALLIVEPRLAAALPNLANALRASSLDAKLREGVILRVAALSQSTYERMQHLGQAGKVGWSEADIAAIESGHAAALPSDVAAVLAPVLAFVDACVAAPTMPDAVFAAARGVLSDRDLATVVLLVGHYMMVARFTGVLEVELDEQPDSWSAEH